MYSLGRLTLSQIKNGSPNDNLKKAQIYVRVIAMDLETTANNQKFPVVVGTIIIIIIITRHLTSKFIGPTNSCITSLKVKRAHA